MDELRPELADVIANEFERELARELILQKNETIDETRFEEACVAGKGNWVDISILYDLIHLARSLPCSSK